MGQNDVEASVVFALDIVLFCSMEAKMATLVVMFLISKCRALELRDCCCVYNAIAEKLGQDHGHDVEVPRVGDRRRGVAGCDGGVQGGDDEET